MSEVEFVNRTVILTSDLKDCGLKDIQKKISDFLKNPQAIKQVRKCKAKDGKVIPGKFELDLFDVADVKRLVSEAVLYLEHDDALYNVRVTRSRPRKDLVSSSSTKTAVDNSQPKLVQEAFAENASSSGDSEKEVAQPVSAIQRTQPRSPKQFYQRKKKHKKITNIPGFEERKSKALEEIAPTTWFDILQSDPDVFEVYSDKCVLVQPESCTVCQTEITDYVQNNSSVEAVKCIRDGFLVLFKTSEAARNFFHEEHTIDDLELRVYIKPVPPVYRDRFLLKGNFEQQSRDEVKDILTGCTEVSFKFKRLKSCDMFFVVLDKELLDFKKVQNALKKLRLNEIKPQVLKVCRSDCIQVMNLKESMTDEFIRVKFMNKKYGDGEVTLVERDKKNRKNAFVYFAKYQDAETFVERAKQRGFSIKGSQLEVSLFCQGINCSFESSLFQLCSFYYTPDVDADILRFVHLSRDTKSDFCKSFGDVAIVEVKENNEHFRIKVEPLSSQGKEDKVVDQEKFERDCQNRIKHFMKKFKFESCHYSEDDIERVKRENKWEEKEVFVEKEMEENNLINVFVRWNQEIDKNVKVIGLRSHVDSFIRWFGKACDLTSQTEKFNKIEFDIIITCGILEDILSFFDEDFNGKISTDELVITFSGSKTTVKQAFKAVKKKLKEIQECDLKFLHPNQQHFVQKIIEAEKTEQSNMEEYIKEKLSESSIKVSLIRREHSLYLKYHPNKKNELERAQEKIQNLLKFQVIPVDGSFDDVIQEDDWKKIKMSIESNGKLCVMEDKPGSSITLVGLPSSFNSGHDQIQKYLEENVETEEKIRLPYTTTEFFSSFNSDIGADEHLANIEWFQEIGGINVKGKKWLVRKAISGIKEIIQTISTRSQVINLPGMSTFLHGDSGKQFIKTTSKNSTCTITLDRLEPPEWTNALEEKKNLDKSYTKENIQNLNTYFDKKKTEKKGIMATVGSLLGITGSFLSLTPQEENSVNVHVIHGDILETKCDVIVNTVGDDFDLTQSQVSSALIAKTGTIVMDECAKNPLFESDIMRVTNAPNINSKKIVHLVIPKTVKKITDNLLEAFKVVETIYMFQSIAIPAIGTGQIGLTDVDAAKRIRRAIDLFRKSNPQHLNEINVVVFEQQMMPAFTDALLKSNSIQFNNASPKQAVHTTYPPVQVQNQAGSVTVKFGDILTSNCQAIFNTVGSDFNLQASQVSKKVLQKAGNSIDTECHSPTVPKTEACRITSGGNSTFKNIVHFVTPNDAKVLAKNLEDVLNFIDKNFNVNSVAIPAIGTGNAKLNVIDVAKAFGLAISNYMSNNPKTLTKIEVVIFDQQLLPHFQTHVVPVQKVLPIQPTKSTVKSKPKFFSMTSHNNEKHKVVLYFTSNNEENMQKAWEIINKKAESKCIKRTITDCVLEYLDDEDWDELKAIEREFDVLLTSPEDKNAENQFVIVGLRNDVTEASTHALKLLQKYSKAVTCADYVTWEYEDPKTKAWKEYSLLANLELENLYKEDKEGSFNIKMKIDGEKNQFFVDFTNCTLTPYSNQSAYKIRRTNTSSCPSNWNGKKLKQLIPLAPHDQEYQLVLKKFEKTLQNIKVIQLDRIENKILFAQFQAQKQEVQERMKSNNVTHLPVTMELFHGTSHDVCEKIYKKGFNRSYAGKNATLYGNGVYFAVKSNYSHNYAVPNQNKERRMFLVDVITGEYAQGARGIIDTPQKPGGSSADQYDSVVNEMQDPNIFVVFKDASAYPLYILTYC